MSQVKLLPTVRRNLAAHQALFGQAPRLNAADAVEIAWRAAISGRGGAGFPLHRKISAIASKRDCVVVANCCEGDPTSRKDLALLRLTPHLVVEGLEQLAYALRAGRVIIAVHGGSWYETALQTALSERPDFEGEVLAVPPGYVASEASAVINFASVGVPKPARALTRAVVSGVDDRPTLVSNAETLSQFALAARGLLPVGAARAVLSTINRPLGWIVLEHRAGDRLANVLDHADPVTGDSWVLAGGLAGRWVRRSRLDDVLAAEGAIGLPSYVVLGADECPVAQTAQALDDLARASSGQCGPCVLGLPAIAADFAMVARRGAGDRLVRRLAQVDGRGGCSHPSGVVRLARSALAIRGNHVCTSGCRRRGTLTELTGTLK